MRKALLLIVVATWTACYSGGDVPPDIPSPSLLIASDDPIFPHKPTWADPKEHGLIVKIAFNFDTRYCTNCHGDHLDGGSGPSCHSCHSVFPHDTLGIAKADHGAYVLKNGITDCATQCHGTDLKGGLSGIACTSCHANYPHAPTWKDPQNHGMQAIGDLKNNCKQCHGMDLLGGISTVSCKKCHDVYPHSTTWGLGDQHGAMVAQNGTKVCTTQCHGTTLQGYPTNADVAQKKIPGCSDCHIALPHAPLGQWDHGHAKLTADGRMDTDACTLCHGSNLTGNEKIPSCYSCHITYPALHRTVEWKELSGHGATVITSGTTTCTICHGNDLLGGVAKTSCKSCHSQYPHGDTWQNNHGQTVHDNATAASQTITQYVQNNCTQSCHDVTVTKTAPACVSCHDPQDRYPHPAGWLQDYPGNPNGGDHGLTVVAASPLGASTAANTAGCLTACHGTDGKNGFLDTPKQCTTCHPHYPHAANWKGPAGAGYSLHGLAVVDTKGTSSKDDDSFDETDTTRFGECMKCHGETVTFTDLSWFNLPKFMDLSNGTQVPRCTNCHIYPHTTYQKWGGPQPWNFYHSTVLNNWYYSEHFDNATFPGTLLEYVQTKCGEAGGCHTDGPHNYNKGSGMAGCNFCHMPKP